MHARAGFGRQSYGLGLIQCIHLQLLAYTLGGQSTMPAESGSVRSCAWEDGSLESIHRGTTVIRAGISSVGNRKAESFWSEVGVRGQGHDTLCSFGSNLTPDMSSVRSAIYLYCFVYPVSDFANRRVNTICLYLNCTVLFRRRHQAPPYHRSPSSQRPS